MVRVCFWSLALHCIIHSPKNKRLLCSAKSVGLFLPFYLCIHVGHTLRGFPIFEPQRFAFLNSIFFFFSSFSRVFVTSEFPASILEIFLRRFLCGQLQIFLFSFLSSILLPFLLASFYHPQRQDSDSDCSVPFCCVMLCPRS